MSTTTMHAYTVPESLVPGHLHPNTQRKYREVLRKFQVTQETTWPDVLVALSGTAVAHEGDWISLTHSPSRGLRINCAD